MAFSEGMAAKLAAERITAASELNVLRECNAEIDALMSSSPAAMQPGSGATDELSRYGEFECGAFISP